MIARLLGVPALLLLAAGATAAQAADKVHVRLNNPSDLEWKVEVRDMVCDNAVVWQGRMKPGDEAKLTVCAGEGGAKLATAVIAGCASARKTVWEGVADGATIDVAEAEEPE